MTLEQMADRLEWWAKQERLGGATESASVHERMVAVARAFPKMLEALEALEARLQECAHSLPGGTTPDRVIAIVGAVPVDAEILKAQMAALCAAREAVKP